jgi:pilus assembly protein CpaF
VGMEGEVVTLQDLFLFDYKAGFDADGKFRGSLNSTGIRPRFLEAMASHGVTVPPALFASSGGW